MCSIAGVSRSSWQRSRPSSAVRSCGIARRACDGAARAGPAGAHRRPCAEATRPRLGRRRAAGRKDDQSSRCAGWPTSRMSYGDGDIRLTVWQNLLISGIPETRNRRRSKSASRRSGYRQGHERARRPRRLHRQYRLQVRRLQHQGHRDGDRRLGASQRSRSIPRSISISPAARTPARSTTSATSACIGAACRWPAATTPWKASTSWSAAASAPTPAIAPRTLPRRQQGRLPAAHRTHPAGLRDNRAGAARVFLTFSRRHDVGALQAMVERLEIAADASSNRRGSRSRHHCPGDGAVLDGAARLAQRLFRRPAVARRAAAAAWTAPCCAGARRSRPRTTANALARCRHAAHERMKLAEGKPLPRRLFAAMAQQDCGQCGYLCETYAAAIASGAEQQAQPVRARRQGYEPHAQASPGR